MTYRAPVKDFLFGMKELAGLEQLTQIPEFEDAGLETAAAVLEECAKFNENVVAPLSSFNEVEGARGRDCECEGVHSSAQTAEDSQDKVSVGAVAQVQPGPDGLNLL